MKTQGRATRSQDAGASGIIPKLVTRSSSRWLSSARKLSSSSGRKGERVTRATMAAHTGGISARAKTEWVTPRWRVR